ncbi:MAG: kynureninase [Elusimicrobia bacterium]|nr:kynureninase [Elusimicrobiota bacterium]
MRFEPGADFARRLDAEDPLASFREQFIFPKGPDGADAVYFAGHSLGLQPRKARGYVEEELDDWASLGVEGHWKARRPWLPYHELLTEPTARLVGAQPSEVVVMNTLTVNLHLMLQTFYRPDGARRKIMIEAAAFPSDFYAVESCLRLHGFDPSSDLVLLAPRSGEDVLRPEDILRTIEREGDKIAVIMLGDVNYLTGEAFDLEAITAAGHAKGCVVGFDLAHGAGNLELKLHDWGPDFAVWCGYKYLNGGPGTLGGCFIHERHARKADLPRPAGWWGHDKKSRFQMPRPFQAIPTAEGWQLSNPPILPLAPLRASLELFDAATMPKLRAKSVLMTGYLEFLLKRSPKVRLITPGDPDRRGAQLSFRVPERKEAFTKRLEALGIVCDFREPDIVRAAPVPLYTRFSDVYRFAAALAPHETPAKR